MESTGRMNLLYCFGSWESDAHHKFIHLGERQTTPWTGRHSNHRYRETKVPAHIHAVTELN